MLSRRVWTAGMRGFEGSRSCTTDIVAVAHERLGVDHQPPAPITWPARYAAACRRSRAVTHARALGVEQGLCVHDEQRVAVEQIGGHGVLGLELVGAAAAR